MPNPIMDQLTVGNTTWDINDGRVGDLADLDTTDKSSIVAAINEAAQSGGGSSVQPYTSNPSAPGTASPGSSDKYARGDHVHPAQSVPAPQTSGTPAALGTAARGSATTYSRSDHVHAKPSAVDIGAVPVEIGVQYAGDFLVVGNNGNVVPVTMSAWTEQTVSTAGAVTQALDPYVIYHFTGALTALTITLNAAATGQLAHYHFDFDCGSTAPTVTIPNTVTMPDSNSFEASKHYEVDIINNYGAVMSWATS